MSLSPLSWYWHRLRAMDLAEITAHVQRKFHQLSDARNRDWSTVPLKRNSIFPKLSTPAAAPVLLREVLRRDAEDILGGRWRAFGHLQIQVDDPPQWQTDYFAEKNLTTNELAFKLDHRALPGGADIKLIWDLSRWHQLARLAQAAYVLSDARPAQKCVQWLEDWVAQNPPFRGWNWTSGLESGMRLIQFTWIDALLAPQAQSWGCGEKLERLRSDILLPHVWFTWRYKAFGSSANNHLLGELAGLILATARWPALAKWGASLDSLQLAWERQVLAQFAEDGGNREQALNYHLFAWELCWQTRLALLADGRKIVEPVEERLGRAARFFWEVQGPREPWDYGDSDDGFVTPLFTTIETSRLEWRDWLRGAGENSSLAYWLSDSPPAAKELGAGERLHVISANDWSVYPNSGIAICESGFWWLRWDLSPLGYLKTAAHGHLDAQHLSIWFKEVALIIDPGTGAYYADEKLRSWLASRAAHNGPCPTGEEYPKRLGPFLWSGQHRAPSWRIAGSAEGGRNAVISKLALPSGKSRRCITRLEDADGWQVDDEFESRAGTPGEFTVLWQCAPGSWVKRLDERKFSLHRADVTIAIEVGDAWAEVDLVENPPPPDRVPHSTALAGMVSPAFRRTVWAPYLKLIARGDTSARACRTTFCAAPAAPH